ncbi:TPA: hypothetical protein ONC71_003890 [Enterobacter kobei]|nr:hypothetical protein [Enterobacter kobei]
MKREKSVITFLMLAFASCLVIVIGSYILNFRSSSISNNPSDWGVLGDYFGGILNPLISLITLFFLIKTYLSQKEELIQSEIAADEQRKISQKTAYIQLLSTRISASYEIVALYRGEMEGVTNAMNAPGNGRSYTSMEGKLYFNDQEQREYRLLMARKIKAELEKIDGYLKEIEFLHN